MGRPIIWTALEKAATEAFFADIDPAVEAVKEALKDREHMITFLEASKMSMENEYIAIRGEKFAITVEPYKEDHCPEEDFFDVMPGALDETIQDLRRWLFLRTQMFFFKLVITQGQRGHGLSSRTAALFAKQAVGAMLEMELKALSDKDESQSVRGLWRNMISDFRVDR